MSTAPAEPTPAPFTLWTGLTLVGLALAATLLNACKPLTPDDSIYYHYARHIADHPADPYGFQLLDSGHANGTLAPPVLLYWWAGVLRLGGSEPLAWKLSLLPFALLLGAMLYLLGRRYAPGRELLFTAAVCLSPVVLPCWNLMLDLPALALMLLAFVVFLRAIDRASFAGVLLAGVVAAVAAQTKYTGALAGGLFLLAGWWYGRLAWGGVSLGVLLALFVGWEGLIAWRYGASHFYLGALQFRVPLPEKLVLVQPLFGYLGSTAVGLLPLTLLALGASARVVLATAVGLAVWFALVVLVPWGTSFPSQKVASVSFGLLGVLLAGCIAVAAARVVRATDRGSDGGFLGLWLLLEVVGYFALTPYVGTRRIIGLTVIAALLVCRLLGRLPERSPRLVGASLAFNAALAVGLLVLDGSLYHGQRVVAETLARHCREADPGATIWCMGIGPCQFYADRAGCRYYDAKRVGPGDRVVAFESGGYAMFPRPLPERRVLVEEFAWRSPLGALSAYQGGNVAITRDRPPRVVGRVWRIE